MSFIFLHTAKTDRANKDSYLFTDPIEIIFCHHPRELPICFQKIENALNGGFYISGFLSYDAGYYLSLPLLRPKTFSFPLCWFGVFKAPRLYQTELPGFLSSQRLAYSISHNHINVSPHYYLKTIEKIKEYIRCGDTYQVNYTFKNKFHFSGDPSTLYATLSEIQPVSYSAYIDTDNLQILCFSPELFFRKTGSRIIMKPMKGTWPRTPLRGDSRSNKQRFYKDEKNRAENVMITDLIRNDLGRIAQCGSVQVKKLCAVETYPTLLQMTSTVESSIPSRIPFQEIFKNLFPSGSVTGAPKIRTMQIIRELEKEERKIYTGAIGLITPERKAVFNVAIRTILLEKGRGELGIGGGITIGSDAHEEFKEAQLKAKFFMAGDFRLIETILWTYAKGFFLLPLHLRRLKKSARYFSFTYAEQKIQAALAQKEKEFAAHTPYRVRLLLSRSGDVQPEYTLIFQEKSIGQPKVKLSSHKTDSRNTFLYHKTTQRALYNSEYKKAVAQRYFDVLFTNEKGELTEGAISNIFIRKGTQYYTPPVRCGLLPGVFRQHFLQTHRTVKEKVLFAEDLLSADEIILTNSVRGCVSVKLK